MAAWLLSVLGEGCANGQGEPGQAGDGGTWEDGSDAAGPDQATPEGCAGNDSMVAEDLPAEVPGHFAAMLGSRPTGTTYYLSADDPCASNENDGLAPSCEEGHGPWKDLAALEAVASDLGPGDGIALRQGTYHVDIENGPLRIATNGTAEEPFSFFAYEAERAVLDGGFDGLTYLAGFASREEAARDYAERFFGTKVLAIGGEHIVVRGIHVRGCADACIVWDGSHSVLTRALVEGSVEDGIKTTYHGSEEYPSTDNLVVATRFWGFGDQAIDAWSTHDLWVVGSRFACSDRAINRDGEDGTPVWTKGGSRHVWYLDNTFEDLDVGTHALDLGGCCWSNWSGGKAKGGPRPVSADVHALRNTFRDVRSTGGEHDGALGVQGCESCEARGNVFIDVTAGLTVRPTIQGDLRFDAEGVVFEGNTLVRASSGRMITLEGSPTITEIDDQRYYQDGAASFQSSSGVHGSLAEWQIGTGFDTSSTQLPASDFPER